MDIVSIVCKFKANLLTKTKLTSAEDVDLRCDSVNANRRGKGQPLGKVTSL